MAKALLYSFLLILLILTLSFSVINAQPVTIHYYLGTRELPLALLMALTLAVGMIVGVIAMLKPMMRLRMEIARLKRSMKLSEKEIANLRSIPVKERR